MQPTIEFEQYYLPNGLRVILHQDRKVPVVAINIWYHVGSRDERKGKTGLAHLFEHMMFQGSAHVPPDMHFKLIQSAGGTLNGSTFFDRTNYFEMLPSHYLEMGLWLEADRMGYLLPALNQEKFDRQREVVMNERRQRVDNMPYGVWFEKLLESVYPENFPYHWPVIGYMEDIQKMSLQDARDFFKRYYAPDNASLVVAGDFERAHTRELIKRYFNDIPPGKPRPQRNGLLSQPLNQQQRLEVKDRVQLPRLYMGYRLPPMGSPESYQAEVLTEILSHGKSTRLYRSLVYEQQIAQDAQAFSLSMEATSLFIFVVAVKPDIKLETVEAALQRELERLYIGDISERERQKALNRIEADRLRELQSVTSKADNLNLFAVYFDNPQLINDEMNLYKKVNLKQLQNLANNYLKEENRVVLHFIPDNKG